MVAPARKEHHVETRIGGHGEVKLRLGIRKAHLLEIEESEVGVVERVLRVEIPRSLKRAERCMAVASRAFQEAQRVPGVGIARLGCHGCPQIGHRILQPPLDAGAIIATRVERQRLGGVERQRALECFAALGAVVDDQRDLGAGGGQQGIVGIARLGALEGGGGLANAGKEANRIGFPERAIGAARTLGRGLHMGRVGQGAGVIGRIVGNRPPLRIEPRPGAGKERERVLEAVFGRSDHAVEKIRPGRLPMPEPFRPRKGQGRCGSGSPGQGELHLRQRQPVLGRADAFGAAEDPAFRGFHGLGRQRRGR